MKVEMNNLDITKNFVIKLAGKEFKALSRSNERFLKFIKKSAKLRAPRDTGELAESIHSGRTITKGRKQQRKLIVSAGHAVVQEEGFRPHKALILNSSKISPGVYFVRKNTPFIKPAIEANLGKFVQNLNLEVGRAMKL